MKSATKPYSVLRSYRATSYKSNKHNRDIKCSPPQDGIISFVKIKKSTSNAYHLFWNWESQKLKNKKGKSVIERRIMWEWWMGERRKWKNHYAEYTYAVEGDKNKASKKSECTRRFQWNSNV